MGLWTGEQLAELLCESVSDLFGFVWNQGHALNRCAVRFVDRDMFMHYRGSGIGHRYMREIEDIYENMSRERVHYKESKRASSSKEPTNMDAVDDSGSDDDEHETEGPTDKQPGQAAEDDHSGSDSDLDYSPPETGSEDSHSSGDNDTEELDSEGKVSDCYGFGDL